MILYFEAGSSTECESETDVKTEIICAYLLYLFLNVAS